jgi:hypothetical protein
MKIVRLIEEEQELEKVRLGGQVLHTTGGQVLHTTGGQVLKHTGSRTVKRQIHSVKPRT